MVSIRVPFLGNLSEDKKYGVLQNFLAANAVMASLSLRQG